MMMKCAVFLALILASLAPSAALALVGEPAPALNVTEWVKGSPVEIKPGTNVFVIEIWQTSLESAQDSIGAFNEIQRRYQTNGVVVVGICDEPVDELKQFVQTTGTNLQYALAADHDRKTSLSYMNPIDERGVPYAFIVGTNGDILWHGRSPMVLNEQLREIFSGTYDMEGEQKTETAQHQMKQYLTLSSRGDARAKLAGRAMLQNRTNDVRLLWEMAVQILNARHLPHRDFGLINQALNQAEVLATNDLLRLRVNYVRATFLFESGRPEEGIAKAKEALAAAQLPTDKKVIETGLRSMESRLAAMKARRRDASEIQATNSLPDASVGGTNPTNTGPAELAAPGKQ